MGTGKTAVGKRLAGILNMDFFDSDQEIEQVTGMSVARLFQKHGEIRFRSEETLMIQKLATKRNAVIATGGGIVLNSENIELLRSSGYLICLTAKPDVIFDRVKRRNNRPLLKKGDTYETIITLLDERKELYQCADFTVDTSNMDFEEIINKILKFLSGKKGEENNIG